ncbi:MAG: glycosyltransferase family 2 protein [Patescibacteria group bacterium]
MYLSVVIPTHNRKDCCKEVLLSFNNQSFKDFEIIIVDDGSKDCTGEMVKNLETSYPLHYVRQDNKGQGAARNTGIKNAQGEVIFFIDDDCVPVDSELLNIHAQAHKNTNNNKAVFLGLTLLHPSIKFTPFVRYIDNYHLAYDKITDPSNVPPGCFYTDNVSVNKQFLVESGMFDEGFFPKAAYEDGELGYRLHKNGMRMFFIPHAKVWHNNHITLKSYPNDMWKRGYWSVRLAEKVPELKYKSNINETKNIFKLILKRIIFNKPIMNLSVKIMNFLDNRKIKIPVVVYRKVLDFYKIQGIKDYKKV